MSRTEIAVIVGVLIVLAVALIPATIGYYLWLARHVAPRFVSLPASCLWYLW